MLSLIASTATLIFGAWIFSKCKTDCSFHLIAEQRLLLLGYYLSIPLGYVAVADYFEFGETETVVGEMKNHAASRRDKTDMVLGCLKTA